MPNQIGEAMNALPTAAGIARPIVFAAGLALGVLGTKVSGMMFSGGKPQAVKTVASAAVIPSKKVVISPEKIISENASKEGLTDKMLLNSKETKNGKP